MDLWSEGFCYHLKDQWRKRFWDRSLKKNTEKSDYYTPNISKLQRVWITNYYATICWGGTGCADLCWLQRHLKSIFLKELSLCLSLKCLKTPDTESLRIRSSKQSQQSAAQEDFLLIISSMTTLILPDPLPALLRCLKMLPGLHFNGLTLSAPADLTAALQKAKRP